MPVGYGPAGTAGPYRFACAKRVRETGTVFKNDSTSFRDMRTLSSSVVAGCARPTTLANSFDILSGAGVYLQHFPFVDEERDLHYQTSSQCSGFTPT